MWLANRFVSLLPSTLQAQNLRIYGLLIDLPAEIFSKQQLVYLLFSTACPNRLDQFDLINIQIMSEDAEDLAVFKQF